MLSSLSVEPFLLSRWYKTMCKLIKRSQFSRNRTLSVFAENIKIISLLIGIWTKKKEDWKKVENNKLSYFRVDSNKYVLENGIFLLLGNDFCFCVYYFFFAIVKSMKNFECWTEMWLMNGRYFHFVIRIEKCFFFLFYFRHAYLYTHRSKSIFFCETN